MYPGRILNFLMGLFGVIILGMTYTYIDKMERLGCACAEHPYRNFIKYWTLVSLFIVVFMMFVPLDVVDGHDSKLGMFYAVFHFLFLVTHLVYLVLSLIYIDHLVKEKCKCSEDVRRELLYFWFLLRAIFLLSVVVIPLFLKLGMTSVAEVNSSEKDIIAATSPRIKDFKKVPKSLRKSFNTIRGKK
jgi:hypothetical protein